MYHKEIICLANSRMHGGRCVAGKVARTREWVRPVSNLPGKELHVCHTQMSNGEQPKVLDILRIPFKFRIPEYYHPEDMLIDDEAWIKFDNYDYEKLDQIYDNPASLWTNSNPSQDRIATRYLKTNPVGASLLLIKPQKTKIVIGMKRHGRKQIRAGFNYKGIKYDLAITDPKIEEKYRSMDFGEYDINDDNPYFCISLGGEYEGSHYKLVAGVILQSAFIKPMIEMFAGNSVKLTKQEVNRRSLGQRVETSNGVGRIVEMKDDRYLVDLDDQPAELWVKVSELKPEIY